MFLTGSQCLPRGGLFVVWQTGLNSSGVSRLGFLSSSFLSLHSSSGWSSFLCRWCCGLLLVCSGCSIESTTIVCFSFDFSKKKEKAQSALPGHVIGLPQVCNTPFYICYGCFLLLASNESKTINAICQTNNHNQKFHIFGDTSHVHMEFYSILKVINNQVIIIHCLVKDCCLNLNRQILQILWLNNYCSECHVATRSSWSLIYSFTILTLINLGIVILESGEDTSSYMVI